MFRKPGEKGHVGKDLRRISQNILNRFPGLSPESRIRFSCRKKASELGEVDKSLQNNVNTFNILTNDSITSGDKINVGIESSTSSGVQDRSQRELDLAKC